MRDSPLLSSRHWSCRSLIQKSTDWLHELNPLEIEEIESALDHLINTHKAPLQCLPSDFPLPRFHKVLDRAIKECEFNSGVFLLRGMPVANKTAAQARWLAWGIGLHLGVPLVQNHSGDLLVKAVEGLADRCLRALSPLTDE